uniref:Uncharacterized protein n=1 Tax=Arundo donax TaxID=35708 RepID=A0A0A9FVL4_ARUDO
MQVFLLSTLWSMVSASVENCRKL